MLKSFGDITNTNAIKCQHRTIRLKAKPKIPFPPQVDFGFVTQSLTFTYQHKQTSQDEFRISRENFLSVVLVMISSYEFLVTPKNWVLQFQKLAKICIWVLQCKKHCKNI